MEKADRPAPRSPRSGVGASATRQAILDAGFALLRDGGISVLTQTRVAQRAGLKQSHLTYYFPTRTDLLLAIAEHAILGMEDTLGKSPPLTPCENAPGNAAAATRPVDPPSTPSASPFADTGAIASTTALLDTLTHRIIDGVPPRAVLGLIVAADAQPEIRVALRAFIARIRQRIRGLLASTGLPDDDDSTLLFHASLVGLAVMHQARLDETSQREVSVGVATLLQRLQAGSTKEAERKNADTNEAPPEKAVREPADPK